VIVFLSLSSLTLTSVRSACFNESFTWSSYDTFEVRWLEHAMPINKEATANIPKVLVRILVSFLLCLLTTNGKAINLAETIHQML
jgi:hypothetical protein